MKARRKKLALWGAGGLLGLVGLLACAVWTLLGVGYLNWLATAPSNLRLVEAAERHPLPPGHALTADLEGDRLVARDFARNRILRSSEDDLRQQCEGTLIDLLDAFEPEIREEDQAVPSPQSRGAAIRGRSSAN